MADTEHSQTAIAALALASRADAAIQQHLAACVESNKALQLSLVTLDKRMWIVLTGVAGVLALTLLQLLTDGRIKSIFQ